MLNSLTAPQRLAVAVALIAGGQAAVIGGASLGLSATVAAALGIVASTLAVATLWASASLVGRFMADFKGHAQRLSTGDLSQDIGTQGSSADGAAVLGALQQLQLSLRQTIGSVRGGADGVSLAAQEIAQGNADLSVRTEQTASNLQHAASSMTRLTQTVNQTADSARTANQLASSASEVAERGGSVVAQVVTTMEEINHSSKKIADIIGTIDGIAFQTNILALNAAVEAARAGEQGRGFAVVAGEVRSLAQRSAEAAREIKSLIGSSVERVESGSRLVQDAGNTMGEIVASVQRVTDIIGEISAAAAEQSSGIGQVNAAVTELDTMTQQNAALVEESAAAAESLKDQSRQLGAALGSFNIGGSPRAANPKAVASKVVNQVANAARRTAAAAPAAKASTPAKAVPAPAKAAAPAPRPAAPAPGTKAPAAPAGDDNWETF
jgi:methyl-accepting chemotaxis protein